MDIEKRMLPRGKQLVLLGLLIHHWDKHGTTPTFKELADSIGSSPSNVNNLLYMLELKGAVVRGGNKKTRSVELKDIDRWRQYVRDYYSTEAR